MASSDVIQSTARLHDDHRTLKTSSPARSAVCLGTILTSPSSAFSFLVIMSSNKLSVGRAVALVLKGNNYECILFDDGCIDLFVDATEVYILLYK
jgi:hypothetical protein